MEGKEEKEDSKKKSIDFPLFPWVMDNGDKVLFFYSKEIPELHFKHSGLDITKLTAEFTWYPPSTEILTKEFQELKGVLDPNETLHIDVSHGQIASDLKAEPLAPKHVQVPIYMPLGEHKWNPFNFKRYDSEKFAVAVVPILPANITQ